MIQLTVTGLTYEADLPTIMESSLNITPIKNMEDKCRNSSLSLSQHQESSSDQREKVNDFEQVDLALFNKFYKDYINFKTYTNDILNSGIKNLYKKQLPNTSASETNTKKTEKL